MIPNVKILRKYLHRIISLLSVYWEFTSPVLNIKNLYDFSSRRYQLPLSATPWLLLDDISDNLEYGQTHSNVECPSVQHYSDKMPGSISSTPRKEVLKVISNNASDSYNTTHFDDEEFDEIIRKSLL